MSAIYLSPSIHFLSGGGGVGVGVGGGGGVVFDGVAGVSGVLNSGS